MRTYAKVVTFIKLVAKKSRGVWSKVASYRTAGEGKRRIPGWNSLCRDWLETSTGKYTRGDTRSFSLFLYFHNRALEQIVFYRLTKCPGAATLVERVTRRSFRRRGTLPLELATPGERDFYSVGIFTETRICKLSATSRRPVGIRARRYSKSRRRYQKVNRYETPSQNVRARP